MRRLLTCFLLLFSGLVDPSISHAFSAIAMVDGHASETIYAAWNYPTQKEADLNALQGCGAQVKKIGITKGIRKCNVEGRQKGQGSGAFVCGDTGCAWATGADTKQEAADSAYRLCEKSKFGNCQSTGITGWLDEAGYPKRLVTNSAPEKTCGPPPDKTVRSKTQCHNGDCIRKFENGCTVRFQATYCHDPLQGNWEWKPDGC